MISEPYHAPVEYPVHDKNLIIIRKDCTHCGSGLAGELASSPCDRFDAAEHELLRVLLTSRGNLREMERHLQTSYPTTRARLDTLLMKLGVNPDVQPIPPQSGKPGSTEQGETRAVTSQEQILTRVATGEISTEVVAQLIAGLNWEVLSGGNFPDGYRNGVAVGGHIADLVAHAMAQHRGTEWRLWGNGLVHKGIGAENLPGPEQEGIRVVTVAEEHDDDGVVRADLAGVVLGPTHLGVSQQVFELADSPLRLPLLLTSDVVVIVLGEVTLLTNGGNPGGHLGATHCFEVDGLGLKLVVGPSSESHRFGIGFGHPDILAPTPFNPR